MVAFFEVPHLDGRREIYFSFNGTQIVLRVDQMLLLASLFAMQGFCLAVCK